MFPFFKKKEVRRKNFTSTDEAVLFFTDLLSKQARGLQDIFKSIEEAGYKERLIMKKISERICEKLEIYGIKISYEDLMKQVRAEVNRDWPRIKREVMEEVEARKKAVDDLLKDLG